MTFISSIILLFISSLLFVSFFSPKNITRFILYVFLTSYSLIVLTAQISGFIGLLSNRWIFLLFQLLELAIIFRVWIRRGKPRLFTNFPLFSGQYFHNILAFAKKNLFTTIFFLLISLGYGILAWLILTVPPNNSDSMHTHLARVMYWLQQGSFEQLTSFSIFAKIYPFDAQLNILWTILFTKSDKFVGFIQFFSAIICAVSIYGISKLLNGSTRSSFVVSLFFLTFPLIVFEATSTQFDLVVTALFTSSIFLFFDFYNYKSRSSIFFSGLSLGLAVGTKETIFMMIPGLIFLMILVLVNKESSLPWLIQWVAIGIFSFLILGSFTYFNNLHYYGNPLGPSEHVSGDSVGGYSFLEKLRYNTPRFFYQFISFDSLPTQIADKGNDFKNALFKTFDSRFNLGLESLNAIKDPNKVFSLNSKPKWNEDESWFGIASFLLLCPAFIIGFYSGVRKKEFITLSIVIIGASFYLFEILLRPGWDPYQGRYFILVIAPLTPLAIHLINDKFISKIFTYLIGIISIITFFTAVFSNESKPILGSYKYEAYYVSVENNYIPKNFLQGYKRKLALTIYGYLWENLPFYFPFTHYDDVQLRTLSNRNRHENISREVEKVVPIDGRMGVILGNGSYDYVFFGPKLERILININPLSLLNNIRWLEAQDIPYILIYDYQRIPVIPDYLHLIYQVDGWGLYKIESLN